MKSFFKVFIYYNHHHYYFNNIDQSDYNCKMVNCSRFYKALESVSIASALSRTLTIYPCQIRVHQTLTVLKTPTSYSSEEGVVAGHSGQFTPGGYLSTL